MNTVHPLFQTVNQEIFVFFKISADIIISF